MQDTKTEHTTQNTEQRNPNFAGSQERVLTVWPLPRSHSQSLSVAPLPDSHPTVGHTVFNHWSLLLSSSFVRLVVRSFVCSFVVVLSLCRCVVLRRRLSSFMNDDEDADDSVLT